MRRRLSEAWATQAPLRSAPSCPTGGGGVVRPAGPKPRKVETGFGPVWLPRQRVCCATCGRHFQPDDVVLAPTLGGGRLSPRLTDLAALFGASWPYRHAGDVLGRLRGAPLSHEAVRAVVGVVGARVAVTHARGRRRLRASEPVTGTTATGATAGDGRTRRRLGGQSRQPARLGDQGGRGAYRQRAHRPHAASPLSAPLCRHGPWRDSLPASCL